MNTVARAQFREDLVSFALLARHRISVAEHGYEHRTIPHALQFRYRFGIHAFLDIRHGYQEVMVRVTRGHLDDLFLLPERIVGAAGRGKDHDPFSPHQYREGVEFHGPAHFRNGLIVTAHFAEATCV